VTASPLPAHALTLSDPDDPRLDDFRGLLTRRPDPHNVFAESEVAVARLLTSPHFHTHAVLGTAPHLARLPIPPTCAVLVAERPLLRQVLGFDLHRGVIARASRPPALAHDLSFATCPIGPVLGASSLAALLAGPRWTVLLAQGLADPANLGSVIRSARAFAVDLVLLDRRGADPLERRAIRAAMGHGFAQPLALAHDLPAALAHLKAHGARILAATASPRARPLHAVAPPDRQVLMVGNEGHGLPPALLAAADLEVTIPIAPEVDSLGVAVATAVLLHGLKASPGAGRDCLS
jgi:tRNA G18 (ribose-2'-O)-methylase SpoU